MTSFEFKTQPFRHQREEWEAHRDDPARAILWEMGVGKTKLAIDVAAWKFLSGKVDAMIVLAPNGVHENWELDEIPAHMPDCVPAKAFAYHAGKASTKWHKAACAALLVYQGFPILCMSYDAVMTAAGKVFAREFIEKRRVFFVLDESHRIKTPGAKRTQAIVRLGKKVRHKMILTGTPVTNKAFDVYTQFRFLDEHFWARHGFASYEAFKTYFGVWRERMIVVDGSERRFREQVAVQNLDVLARLVGELGSRLLKTDVLDLPPKLFARRYFELSPYQRQLYEQLSEQLLAELDGGLVTAQIAITKMLRLQQITCGFVVTDEGETIVFGENPRLASFLDFIDDIDDKVIIWAHFHHDVDKLCEALGSAAVRYDGLVSPCDRLDARRRFQEGDAKYLVGNPAAGGMGITLHASATTIYYSRSFNLEHWLQSQDRNHRIGQDRSVTYTSLIARDTIDEHILAKLLAKHDLAKTITRDELASWLRK